MLVARVKGPVYSVIHHPAYDGRTLLCVVPLNTAGERARSGFLAVDLVGAGAGDLVMVGMPPGYAAEAIGLETAPIRSLVLGIIDRLELASGVAASRGEATPK